MESAVTEIPNWLKTTHTKLLKLPRATDGCPRLFVFHGLLLSLYFDAATVFCPIFVVAGLENQNNVCI